MVFYETILKDVCSDEDYSFMKENYLLNEEGYMTYVAFSNNYDGNISDFSFKEHLEHWAHIGDDDNID